jgi:hypothetical protein
LYFADLRDTNLGSYFEIGLLFLVNEHALTVSTQDPYAYLSESFSPKNKLYWVKLLLSQQIPIDYGRELLGYDKNPVPQNIQVNVTPEDAAFNASDPRGHPLVSGHSRINTDPVVQAHALSGLVAAPDAGDVLEDAMVHGAPLSANLVNRDVLNPSDALRRSYIVVRPKSAPAIGLFDSASTLTVNPHSDFGATVNLTSFHPVISMHASFRGVLDTGFVQ